MGETGLALTIVGSLLLCGGVLWLAISKAKERTVLPPLGAVLFSLTLTVVGVSLWLAAGIGVSEGQPDAPERKPISGAGGSIISLAWEEVMQPENAS
ncbi:MAG: hypothetical protein IIB15_07245 [Chloroflexi bacterium]|nr:hypothetical protein [Chloroflexota bacterium]